MVLKYNFMKNTLIDFDQRVETSDIKNIITSDITGRSTMAYSITLVDRKRIAKIEDFVAKIDKDWVREMRIQNNTTLEKISYDLYQTPDYWDLLLFLNLRMPIWDMPYDYDVVSEAGDTAITEFESEVFGKRVSERVMWDGVSTRDRIKNAYQDAASEVNNEFSTLKYVDPSHIYDMINLMYEEGMR